MKRMIILGAALLFARQLHAQDAIDSLESRLTRNPSDPVMLMQLGKAYHSKAVSGSTAAVDKGFECFDKILASEPANALALVYRGSLWTMRARDAWWPFTKLHDVDNGIDEMDKAVELAPDAIEVRIVRGINSTQLPSMFRRNPIAMKDFAALLARPDFPHFDPGLQSTIYYWAGVASDQDNQPARARELFQKAADCAPGSGTAEQAKAKLKELS